MALNRPHTQEEKEHLRKMSTGRKFPYKPYSKERLITSRIAWKNRIITEETRQKLRDANKRQTLAGKASQCGVKQSTERRSKSAERMKGNTLSVGRKVSIETRDKLRLSHLGKKKTPEMRAKMKQIALLRQKSKPFTQTSKSATLFLNSIESEFKIPIERETRLGRRFFDGQVGFILLEVDGHYWHTRENETRIDIEKEELAKKYGYIIYRFEVNSVSEVQKRVQQYASTLFTLFQTPKHPSLGLPSIL